MLKKDLRKAVLQAETKDLEEGRKGGIVWELWIVSEFGDSMDVWGLRKKQDDSGFGSGCMLAPLTREQNMNRGTGMGARMHCFVCSNLCLVWCLAFSWCLPVFLSETCRVFRSPWWYLPQAGDDGVLTPKLHTEVAVSAMWCWSVFQNFPPSLLHWGLPSWSFISFALPCLRCSSPPSHVGVSHTKRKRFMENFHNSYFHFSNISSDVTCSENSWSGIRWISPLAPNLPWLCPVVGWSSLQTPLLSTADFARLHNRWHQTRRNLGISRREKGLGSFLLPCFCQCHHDNGNGLHYLIFYFILASCTPNPAAMGEILSLEYCAL